MRLNFRTRFLLSLSLLIIGYGSVYGWGLQPPLHSVAVAAPLIQNSNPDCPPNSGSIWVGMSNYQFLGAPDGQVVHIPFENGYVELNGHIYVNYLLGVLLREIGPVPPHFDPVDEELMKAQAILARTVTYKNCGIFSDDGHPGMDDRNC